MEKKIDVWIDGHLMITTAGSTIMQACLSNQIEIPRFCYHDQLSIAGNCRMCLVEVEKSAKLVASCAMPVHAGMKIMTQTSIVKKAREGVLEFLLINHPLDCPICDQGGECDLQDQAMVYGSDRGRFYEFKRSVKDKNVGPLIKTIMTRCIHCTRCVRFASEVAMLPELGTSGRGGNVEITTYIKKIWLDTNLSGNVVDLCPVGALTSKPYAFRARPWELRHTETIDTLDAFGSWIRIDSNSFEILRVLPRFNPFLNGEWISDKTRYGYDGIKKQRIVKPLLRDSDSSYRAVSWNKALTLLCSYLESSTLESYVGDISDLESIWMLKVLHDIVGSQRMHPSTRNIPFLVKDREDYLFSDSFQTLRKRDFAFVIGSDLEMEAPLLRLQFEKGLTVASVGASNNKPFPSKSKHYGITSAALQKIAQGKHPLCAQILSSRNPICLVGLKALPFRELVDYILSQFNYRNTTNILRANVIHATSHQVAALEVGFSSGGYHGQENSLLRENVNKRVIFFHNAEELEKKSLSLQSADTFLVYMGSHGDFGAEKADLILPGLSPVEKVGSYVSMDGKVQKTSIVMNASGSSELDSCVLGAILLYLLHRQHPLCNKSDLHTILCTIAKKSLDSHFPELTRSRSLYVDSVVEQKNSLSTASTHTVLGRLYTNYYDTNSIVRASASLSRCAMLKQAMDSQSFPN